MREIPRLRQVPPADPSRDFPDIGKTRFVLETGGEASRIFRPPQDGPASEGAGTTDRPKVAEQVSELIHAFVDRHVERPGSIERATAEQRDRAASIFSRLANEHPEWQKIDAAADFSG